MFNTLIEFTQFGLDRTIPRWTPIDRDPVYHLGPGRKHIPGTIELEWPEHNFDDPAFRIDCPDDGAGGVIATHVLEHLQDPRPLLREISRVLAPGCPANILVPHAQSLMYLQDLDHRTPFVIETWQTLLDNPYYEKEHHGFRLRVGANLTIALAERNTALVTQLIKKGSHE